MKRKKSKKQDVPTLTTPQDNLDVAFQEIDAKHLDEFLGPQLFAGRYGAIKREVVTWAKYAKKKKFKIFKALAGMDKKAIEAMRTSIAVALRRAHLPFIVRYSIDKQVFVVVSEATLKEVYNGSSRV